jgi:ectoine hydroxylase-related dioxygenase (phytanoyl-CoA dioxygenase family)
MIFYPRIFRCAEALLGGPVRFWHDQVFVKPPNVQYVPGSHRWYLLPREHLTNDMNAIFNYLNPEQKADFKPVPSILKAGEASFHHPMTLHGSYENRSMHPRRGVVINFMRDGVRSNSDEPLLDGVSVIPAGQEIEGRFFPLLSL